MRRILLCLACGVVLTLPAAASAGSGGGHAGFLVVRNGEGDGGVYGPPVVTVVVDTPGFVLGRLSQEARVDIYHLPTVAGQGAPQAAGPDVSHRVVRWRRFTGTEYSGSGFRFRAIGGAYRVVVRGSGVYIFAGGRGSVTLRGSSVYPNSDGRYSIDGAQWSSLPTQRLRLRIGGG